MTVLEVGKEGREVRDEATVAGQSLVMTEGSGWPCHLEARKWVQTWICVIVMSRKGTFGGVFVDWYDMGCKKIPGAWAPGIGKEILRCAQENTYLLWQISAWAAARRAMGTRNGLQET